MPDKIFTPDDAHGLRNAIHRIVRETPVTDIHTHLYAPAFGDLLLRGPDELLTYHYLAAEYFRFADTPYEEFWALPKARQAEAIWRALFVERAPLSEACRGVVTALAGLGADLRAHDLDAIRAHFADWPVDRHVDAVFRRANVRCAVMTNDPFDDAERPVWEAGWRPDDRFLGALRIDPLLNDWPAACARLQGWGYAVGHALDEATLAEVRRFLDTWAARFEARYCAVSLPPDFAYPEDTPRARLIADAVLPVCRQRNIPFALMIGVSRQVNPALRVAGDGVGTADLGALERLCAAFPQNKFMATLLARENQHGLCVAARKFRNLLVFGCWWFLNNPSLIEEMTRMRVEMLGASIIPQHSDARVLDQIVYKWDHSREIITRVLRHKYADLIAAGWPLAEADIRTDVEAMLGGNFWRFLEWKP